MGSWLLTIESNCNDPAHEKEFNDWYDNIHVPDLLETEGFIRGTRYQLEPGELVQSIESKGKYLAVYEIESDDIVATMAKVGENMGKKAAQGRMSSLIATTSRGLYKKISSISK